MWEGIKSAARTLLGSASSIIFILAGAGLLYTSYHLLALSGTCSTTAGPVCSQVNLAFGLLSGLLAAAFILYGVALHALRIGQIGSLQPVYEAAKSFFGSTIFFILFGCILLYFAVSLLHQTHPAFVFILAILGVSMILFGTGSQAVASANVPATVGINASIAGGAAALAAIFGYGSVVLSEGIKGFFQETIDYGVLELTTLGTPTPNFNLLRTTIRANTTDGRPLPLWTRLDTLQIMIPRYSKQGTSTISVTFQGSLPVDAPNGELTAPYSIDWSKIDPEEIFGSERMYIARKPINLILKPDVAGAKPPEKSFLDEKGQPVNAPALTPG
jgi:hypothetical protein